MYKRNHNSAFTIVELLIVIVVIGILATIILIAYGNIQEQAKMAKARSDISEISKAIDLARSKTGKTLYQITGNDVTELSCMGYPNGTNLATLPRTSQCWVDYTHAIVAISQASDTQIGDVTDPWGRPYQIDENEGVNGSCNKDTVTLFAYPFTSYAWGGDSRLRDRNVPLSGFTGCAVDPND